MTIDATRNGLRSSRVDAPALGTKATELLGEAQSLGNLPDFGAMLARAASEVASRTPRGAPAAENKPVVPNRDRLDDAIQSRPQKRAPDTEKRAEKPTEKPEARARETHRSREAKPESGSAAHAEAKPVSTEPSQAKTPEYAPDGGEAAPDESASQATAEETADVATTDSAVVDLAFDHRSGEVVASADEAFSSEPDAQAVEKQASAQADCNPSAASAETLTNTVAPLTHAQAVRADERSTEAVDDRDHQAGREPQQRADAQTTERATRRERRPADAPERSEGTSSEPTRPDPQAAKAPERTESSAERKHEAPVERGDRNPAGAAASSASGAKPELQHRVDVRADVQPKEPGAKPSSASPSTTPVTGPARPAAKPTVVTARQARAENVEQQLEQMMRARRQEAATTAVNRMTLRNGAQGSVELPELGKVHVSARMRAGEVDVDIRAQRPETVTVLQSAGAALEAELRHGAVNLRHVDIDHEEGEPRQDKDGQAHDFQREQQPQRGDDQPDPHEREPQPNERARFML